MTGFSNPLRRIWAQGGSAVNGWLAIPSIISVEIMARAGWDSLTIDLQHGTASYDSLLAMLPVIHQTNTVPLVRVPWNDPADVMRALDAGALGIICPMIDTADDAARFVSYCRYPPEGTRSFGPIRARLAWGDDYGAQANNEILPLAMIETKQAIDNLQEILKVDGLGGIYIGPADLSSALGHTPGFDREEPELLEVIGHILSSAREQNIPACIHCGSPEYAARMIKQGFSMVTIGSDARLLEAGCKSMLERYKTQLT